MKNKIKNEDLLIEVDERIEEKRRRKIKHLMSIYLKINKTIAIDPDLDQAFSASINLNKEEESIDLFRDILFKSGIAV